MILKRILSAAAAVSVLVCSSFTALADESAPKHYTLSLADAIKIAKENSITLKCCDINKQKLKKDLKAANIAKNQAKKAEINGTQAFELVLVKQGYYAEAAKAQLNLADEAKKQKEANIEYNVTNLYFSYKNASDNVALLEKTYENVKSNLETAEKSYSLGLTTKLDLDAIDLSAEKCKNSLEQMKRGEEIAKDSFRIALNLGEGATFTLTDSITVSDFASDIESNTAAAMKTRYDVKQLESAKKLADKYFDIVGNLDKDNSMYYTGYANKLTAEENLKSGTENIRLAIKSSYNSVLTSIENSGTSKRDYEQKQKEYDIYKLKFEMGTVTGTDLAAKTNEVTSAAVSYNTALLTQKLAAIKYGYDISIGL